MANERNTEKLIRDQLATAGYTEANGIQVEEQQSTDFRIIEAFKNASKSKSGSAPGYPEFIVKIHEGLVLIVECKASPKKHESKGRNRPKGYAVDGALHYAKHLVEEGFNVIAVGASGEKEEELRVSSFLITGGSDPKELDFKQVVPVNDYRKVVDGILSDPATIERQRERLLKFSGTLHIDLRAKASLSEKEKPLLVSAILIALTDGSFRDTYKRHSGRTLANRLYSTVKETLEDSDIVDNKIEPMMAQYAFIKHHKEFVVKGSQILLEFIYRIEKNVYPLMTHHNDIDALGHFYGEFIRYGGSDGNGLGIVLTPKHITQLFCDLVEMGRKDIVYDSCMGTAQFLISAMHRMCDGATDVEIEKIKSNQLIGVEKRADMFVLAAANMILRDDGKSNMFNDSCFEVIDRVKEKKPTVGLMNPPYAQDKKGKEHNKDQSEFHFIKHLLDALEPRGRAAVIVPMKCALNISDSMRAKTLEEHTLVAVMSLPDDLFYPVGVNPCVMVFKAHVPHDTAKDSWFGYWKDDGLVKIKDKGRVDLNGVWEDIRKSWVNEFLNRDVIPGRSVRKAVGPENEWCAEAYMETDYSKVSQSDFEQVVRRYIAYQVENDVLKQLS